MREIVERIHTNLKYRKKKAKYTSKYRGNFFPAVDYSEVIPRAANCPFVLTFSYAGVRRVMKNYFRGPSME
jgi:hypothetical protein